MRGHVFIRSQVARLANACQSAQGAASRAKTFPELVRASHVPVPSYLRQLMHRECNSLKAHAERVGEVLFERQVAELNRLAAIGRISERAQRLDQLRQEWLVLSGNFPKLAHRARRIS